MFKWLRRLLVGKRERVIPDPPEDLKPTGEHNLYELADLKGIQPTTAHQLHVWREHLASLAPVAVVRPVTPGSALEATGVAMDSFEGESDYIEPDFGPAQEIAAPVPTLSNYESPNLPGAITGFFLRNTFIGHQLAALLAQHYLIGKCCWMPARDAVRKGYTYVTPENSDDREVVKMLERQDKRYKIKRNLTEFIGFGKTFGVRIAIFLVDSDEPDYYEHPFNPDNVKPGSYRGLSQVDPYWCVPEIDGADLVNPASQHFYEPTWWVINGKRYHRTHLAIYREGDVADILKPVYLYGGIPVPQKIIERVYAAERTANEAPEVAMTKRTTVLKTSLEEMIAAGPEALAKLELWTQFRNNFSVKLIGSDEDLQQHDMSLADFDNTIMTEYQLVAAAANVPSTKLLGTSPKGFGATGEYEIESYHEELESIQEDQLTALVDRHHLMVMLSDVAPVMQAKDSAWRIPDISISWNPLDTPTSKEVAEINYINAQTDQVLVNAGAIDGVDARDRLIKSPDSGYAGIPGAYRPGEDPEDTDAIPITVIGAPTYGTPQDTTLSTPSALDSLQRGYDS